MASRMQQADLLFRDYQNELSHLEIKDDSSQLLHRTPNKPLYSNHTLIYPNLIQPQQTFTHPTFQQHPPLTQLQPNSQHIYQAKKSGIVNEIINTINNHTQN
eukprot:382642_1